MNRYLPTKQFGYTCGMSHPIPVDVSQAIESLLATGRYDSEADGLRNAIAALRERDDDLTAILAGIADMEAGRCRPLSKIDAEFRRRHNIGSSSA